jgi:hypothetical protein
MNVTEVSFVAAAAAAASGKALPSIGQSPAHYANEVFETGAYAPDRPGVFVLTVQYAGRAHPIYVGESESMIVAVNAVLASNPVLKRLAAGVFWKVSPFSLTRRLLVDELIEEYQPHFNLTPEEAPQAEPATASTTEIRVLDPIELIARF